MMPLDWWTCRCQQTLSVSPEGRNRSPSGEVNAGVRVWFSFQNA